MPESYESLLRKYEDRSRQLAQKDEQLDEVRVWMDKHRSDLRGNDFTEECDELDALLSDKEKTKPLVIHGGVFECQLDHLDEWPWDDGMFRVYPTTTTNDAPDGEEQGLVPVRITLEKS